MTHARVLPPTMGQEGPRMDRDGGQRIAVFQGLNGQHAALKGVNARFGRDVMCKRFMDSFGFRKFGKLEMW